MSGGASSADARLLLVDDGELDRGRAPRPSWSRTPATGRSGRSHYHFAESNAALRFDRAAARGMRLNIASGTAVRMSRRRARSSLAASASTTRVGGARCWSENSGDRPIQVGSRYHFPETSAALLLDSLRGARLRPDHATTAPLGMRLGHGARSEEEEQAAAAAAGT